MNFSRQVSKGIQVFFICFGALLLLLPIIWTFTTSFKTAPEINIVPPPILPKSFLNLNNYVVVLQRLLFARLLLNSLVLCTLVVATSLTFSSMTGYGFAKYRFPGKEIAFFSIVAVLMVPFQSVAVPLFRWMDTLNLVDTFAGLALPLLISSFGVILMREYCSTIPNSLIEAARIDGCSEFRIYFVIIMPLLKPAMAALAIIKFMWTWNEFFWPLLIITERKKAVVTLGLSFLSNQFFKEYHLVTALRRMKI